MSPVGTFLSSCSQTGHLARWSPLLGAWPALLSAPLSKTLRPGVRVAPGTAPSSASVLPQLAVLRPGGCPPPRREQSHVGRTVPGGSSSPGPRCPHWSGRHGLPMGESRLCPSLGRCCSTGDTGVQVPSQGVSTLHRPGLGLRAPSLWLRGTAPPEEVSPGRAPTHSPLSLHVKVTAPPHSRVTAVTAVAAGGTR